MKKTPFHTLYKACKIKDYQYGYNKLIPVFASSNIEIYPFQITAALFALRSPYIKGAILCDDGSLGKTYEALLVVSQKWFVGDRKILIVLPTHLVKQWVDKTIIPKFSLPVVVLDNKKDYDDYIKTGSSNPFLQDKIIVTTYDFAATHADDIKKVDWDLTVFDEAHFFSNMTERSSSVKARVIHDAVRDRFKILLTNTPMFKNVLNLYSLINFIDDSVFSDEYTFYKRYFRHEENYDELANRISKYCYRTLRRQVTNYVKIPKRLTNTIIYKYTQKEQKLHNLTYEFVRQYAKQISPNAKEYNTVLDIMHAFSSSMPAFINKLQLALNRMKNVSNAKYEQEMLEKIIGLAKDIKRFTKTGLLLDYIELGFSKLKKLGAKKKALIFVENKATQKYLYDILKEKYKTLIFNGGMSRNYDIFEQFQDEGQILISTDIASEGSDFEFCSFIINYDSPYSSLRVEQRISRCHRQGQLNEVFVLNFLNPQSCADVRILELYNKRHLVFSGVLGLSDDILGEFTYDFDSLNKAANKNEIEKEFQKTLNEHKDENMDLVSHVSNMLFSSFTEKATENIYIKPGYVKEKVKQLNDDIWYIVSEVFGNNQNTGFKVDEETKSLFYDGSDIDSFMRYTDRIYAAKNVRRHDYSMNNKKYRSYSRLNLNTPAIGNIISNVINDFPYHSGEIKFKGKGVDCRIGLYKISVFSKSPFFNNDYYVFVGRQSDGVFLDNDRCLNIMELPVLDYKSFSYTDIEDELQPLKPLKDTATEDEIKERNREIERRNKIIQEAKEQERKDGLYELIDKSYYIKKSFDKLKKSQNEYIEKVKYNISDEKFKLDLKLKSLDSKVKQAKKKVNEELDRFEKVKLQKELGKIKSEFVEFELKMNKRKHDLDCKLNSTMTELNSSTLDVDIQRLYILNVTFEDKGAIENE